MTTTATRTQIAHSTNGAASSLANRLTALIAGVAASAATLVIAVSPSLSHAAPTVRVVELPRVVITAAREHHAVRTVELPRVVINATRDVRTVELPRVLIVAKRSLDGAQVAQAGL